MSDLPNNIQVPNLENVTDCCFNPEGTLLAFLYIDGSVRIFESDENREFHSIYETQPCCRRATSISFASSDNGAICDTCTVAIKDYVLSKDTDGKDIIIINFDFSNSDSEGKSFSISASTQVFQDGVELSHAYFVENYSSENSLKQVRDGATIAVQDAFELNNLTSPVEVEVSDTFDFLGKSEILKKTFELQ